MAGSGRHFLHILVNLLLLMMNGHQMPCLTMTTTTTTNMAARRAWGRMEQLNTSSIVTASTTTTPFDIYRVFLKDDGTFPNNEQYPALLYKSAFTGTQDEGARKITLGGYWTSPWVWG